MSADNMVYLQHCKDGKWRAWHGFASGDACDARPHSGYIVETESRSDAIVAAHDWSQKNYTEYGVVELDDECKEPPPLYTAEQLKAAVLAERERCAAIATYTSEPRGMDPIWLGDKIAAAIRKGEE